MPSVDKSFQIPVPETLWYRIWHHRLISQTKTKWEGLEAFQNLMDTNYAALLTPFVFLNWNYNGDFFSFTSRGIFLKWDFTVIQNGISKNTHLNASLQSSLCLLMEGEYIKCVSSLLESTSLHQLWFGKTCTSALSVGSHPRYETAPLHRPFVLN